jgi:hypothetical protein
VEAAGAAALAWKGEHQAQHQADQQRQGEAALQAQIQQQKRKLHNKARRDEVPHMNATTYAPTSNSLINHD